MAANRLKAEILLIGFQYLLRW